jgi:CHASE2 domain-containing sensor protein
MGKRVILTLMEGSFEQGFPAILRISSDGSLAETEIQIPGKLPSAPNVLEQFKNWQLAYRQMVMLHSRIKAKRAQVTNISYLQSGSDLVECLNDWLNSGFREWQKIRDGLQRHLSDTDEIEVIIQTNDIRLRQLPWHLWDLFEHYPLAEVALSAPEYQQPKKSLAKNSKGKVRILAILGNSKGIHVEKDKAFLEQLSHEAQIKFLVEPQREELNDQLWEKGWDILFFAGHSSSQKKGQIFLNETDAIALDQLKYALKKAIAHGLRLAIFNSCEGLGLAQALEDVHIGQVIVMREPVPDAVAQAFLKCFLTAFSSGKSLYAAVREARERLQKLEGQYLYATWLPVICQNPAEVPPTWQELCSGSKPDFATGLTQQNNRQILPKKRIQTVLVASVVVTALVMGVRHLGMLQTWELQAYDQLMRSRPDEGPDSRLLVVAIKDEDLLLPEQKHRRKGTSLSDLALARLLEKLEAYQPRAIGLDIFRDFPVEPKQVDLKTRLRQNENFFAICNVGEPGGKERGISPPPDIAEERQGFSNVLPDSDGIVRRHLLSMDVPATSRCHTSTALSVQLASRYLKAKGITRKFPQGNWQLGKVVFKRLQLPTGGYQKADTWGNQVLLNYRSYRSPLEIADKVTLTDVLRDRVKSKFVKDRIVLIGVMTRTSRDRFLTPYSAGQSSKQEMPGVILHAQMVSQILSAVLDGRPLLWIWPQWGEVLWVWGWSFVGGMLAWRFRSLGALALTVGVTLGVLYGLCFSLITQGGWVPLVPSALTLVATGGSVIAYFTFQTQRQQLTSGVCNHDLDKVAS